MIPGPTVPQHVPLAETDSHVYVMTDVVGSTRLWLENETRMDGCLGILDRIFADIAFKRQGILVGERGEGDSHFFVFQTAENAVRAVTDIGHSLASIPELSGIALRTAIHQGASRSRSGDYYGTEINRCARLRSICHPRQILVTSAVRRSVADVADIEFKSVGTHRLRDMPIAEEIFQLVSPSSSNEYPPLPTARSGAHGLPTNLTSLVGRSEESRTVRDLIRRHRLVTLIGPGGVGKTRLAVDAVSMVADEFEGGAWFVDLRTSTTIEMLNSAIFAAFCPLSISSESAMLEWIGQRSVLFLLDNCEQIVTECKQFIRRFSNPCPNLHFLLTSRRVLKEPGERAYLVPTLPMGPTEDGAVRLFLDRVPELHLRDELQRDSLPMVREICEKLDGLPLAIEITASWMDLLSIREISDRLDEFLEKEAVDDSDPQYSRTVAATIESSRRLLSQSAQRLLDLLTLFPATWTLDSARAVAEGAQDPIDSVEAAMRELIGMSLIIIQANSPANVPVSRRFRMLQTTHQVLERGIRSELRAEKGSFVRFFLEQSRRAQNHWDSGEDRAAMELVQPDYDNFIQALQWSSTECPTDATAMAFNLRHFWMRSSLIQDGQRWFKRLSLLSELSTADRVGILSGLASFCIRLDDLSGGEAALLEALSFLEDVRNFDWARVTCNLATIWQRRGELQRARDAFEQCYEVFRDTRHRLEEALALINLGVCMMRLQEPLADCISVFEKSVRCGEETGSASMLANAYSSLGEAHSVAGDDKAALEYCRKSIDLYRTGVWLVQTAWTFVNVANLLVKVGEFDRSTMVWYAARRMEKLANAKFSPRQEEILGHLTETYRVSVSAEWVEFCRASCESEEALELTESVLQLIVESLSGA